jgi:hypothetical protein
MNIQEVWVANGDGTEIVRARDIVTAAIDSDGNVTVRLVGAESRAVTVAGPLAHRNEHRSGDFHQQLIRVIAQLSDATGAFLVRAVHDETRGWHWASEQL